MRSCLLVLLLASACAHGSGPGPRGEGGTGGTGGQPSPAPQDLPKVIDPIGAKHGVPGMGAAILDAKGLQALGVSGVRREGDPTAVAAGDEWHLGSDTKAMTATLVGMFVD